MILAALFAAIVGVILCGFFSGAETGLYCVNRLRLHLLVQENRKSARRLAAVLADEQGALATTLLGTNVCDYVVTTAVTFLLLHATDWSATRTEIYTVALVTPVLFVFGQVVPKNLFQVHADVLMTRTSALFFAADRIFRLTGVIWLLGQLSDFLQGLFSSQAAERLPKIPKRRVTLLLQDALASSQHGEHQSDLIDRVLRLSETEVRSVLIPRDKVTTLSSAADRRELIQIVRRSPHGTIPVYGGRKERIVGVVKVDELLRDDDWKVVAERIHPVISLKPGETLANAMMQMQAQKSELALVSPRDGTYLGIVTLRDLLEQLIGELGET